MEITIDLTDEFFDEDEWTRLQDFFDKNEKDNLSEDFEKIILAALCEYKEMFVGRGFPTRADEIRQYRLFYLIKHYFGELPSESDVSAMFQETQSRSRSLIRLVLTKFRYDLKNEIDTALIMTLIDAKLKEGETPAYHVTIESDIIVEELNRLINKNAPKCLIVRRISGTGRNYSISEDSFKRLLKHYEDYSTDDEEMNDLFQQLLVENGLVNGDS